MLADPSGFVWGAIRESNPFMFGSQPNVFTVSPIAPRKKIIKTLIAFGKSIIKDFGAFSWFQAKSGVLSASLDPLQGCHPGFRIRR